MRHRPDRQHLCLMGGLQPRGKEAASSPENPNPSMGSGAGSSGPAEVAARQWLDLASRRVDLKALPSTGIRGALCRQKESLTQLADEAARSRRSPPPISPRRSRRRPPHGHRFPLASPTPAFPFPSLSPSNGGRRRWPSAPLGLRASEIVLYRAFNETETDRRRRLPCSLPAHTPFGPPPSRRSSRRSCRLLQAAASPQPPTRIGSSKASSPASAAPATPPRRGRSSSASPSSARTSSARATPGPTS